MKLHWPASLWLTLPSDRPLFAGTLAWKKKIHPRYHPYSRVIARISHLYPRKWFLLVSKMTLVATIPTRRWLDRVLWRTISSRDSIAAYFPRENDYGTSRTSRVSKYVSVCICVCLWAQLARQLLQLLRVCTGWENQTARKRDFNSRSLGNSEYFYIHARERLLSHLTVSSDIAVFQMKLYL